MLNLDEYAKEFEITPMLSDVDERELVTLLHAAKTKLYLMRRDMLSNDALKLVQHELEVLSGYYTEEYKNDEDGGA